VLAFVVTCLSITAVLVPLVISVSLVFRVSDVVNFGAGHVCVFAGAACAAWGAGHSVLGAVVTVVAGAVLGALTYAVAIVPARRRNVRPIGLTLSTLGFGLLLAYATRVTFGGEPSIVQPWLAGSVQFGGFQTSKQRLLVIGLSAVLLVLLYALFDRTLIGRTLTAVAHDRELSEMYGVRGSRFELLAWIVSGVCLVLGGLFQASLASVSVDVAPTLLVFSLVGAVVGGLGSLAGAVGGAFVAAVAMAASESLFGANYHLTASFVVLFLALLVRPYGLFAFRATAERV
jgi:branched-chain amino acid transport system permease protein